MVQLTDLAFGAGNGAGFFQEALGQVVGAFAEAGQVVVVALQVVDALTTFHYIIRAVVQAGDGIELSGVLFRPFSKGGELAHVQRVLQGELILEDYLRLLNKKTKIVALSHVSNTLGTINPVKEMIGAAHDLGIPVLLDGAQAASHLAIDVQDLGCDFYCFSGHKSYAPMGGGVLYARIELLEQLEPFEGGGEMVDTVTFEKTTYNELPFKFEAGTPNVGAILGLDSALDYPTFHRDPDRPGSN